MRTLRNLSLAAAVLVATSIVLADPAAATTAADGPKIVWPAGWANQKPTGAATKQLGINATIDAGALLTEIPASDLADDLKIVDFAKNQIAKIKTADAFKTGKYRDPVKKTVGGHDAAVVEADIVIDSTKFHYQFIFVKEGGYFCTVYLWALPSRWKQAAPQADALISALR